MANYFNQPYRNPYQPNGLRIIPVASDSEINAFTTDFNGAPTYFHNQATNEIVIKQFDLRTGLTSIQKFIKSDNVQGDLTQVKPEVDTSKYDEEINVINDRLEGIEKTIADLSEKGGKR